MKRTTIKDLARLLALSPSTISRALSDHPDISDATKRRVREAAQATAYVPNLRARYLRAQHSRLVALVIPEMNTFFVPGLISGINRVLGRHDYSLVVFQSEDDVVLERKLMQLSLNLSADGVLLARASSTTELSHLDALAAAGVPVVLLDKVLHTGRHATVSIDDAGAAALATGRLLDAGHRRLVGLFADRRLLISAEREAGFRRAFEARGLDPALGHAVEVKLLGAFDEAMARAFASHASPSGEGPTAVFAMSDELLVRAHHHLLAAGSRIPADVSLTAISDGQAPYFLYPNVTHVRHAGAEVGAEAAHVLVGLMGRESAAAVDVRMPTRLVELASVAPRAPSQDG